MSVTLYPPPAAWHIDDFPPVGNICDQVLREVYQHSRVSLAHVVMERSNTSLLHQHHQMSEVYVIVEGEGILTRGDEAFAVTSGAYVLIPPNTPHQLENTGATPLEHLVFAVPPFIPTDIHLVEQNSVKKPTVAPWSPPHASSAFDGGMIQEYLTADERRQLGISLALGSLSPGQRSMDHYHQHGEELYYVVRGRGKAEVGRQLFPLQKGTFVFVPKFYVHHLENESTHENLVVLCLSVPPYRDDDFIRI